MCSMAVIASDYLLGVVVVVVVVVAVVVAVGELVAEVVGTDKILMDSGSTSRSPMDPFLEACFRTSIVSFMRTSSLKIMVKNTTTLPFLSRKKENN